ncbi:amidase family protein [Streptomyces roseoverticillatus]|uniref:amidase family protein n=1 Tax=Streptomyces roseoverticillatus TaxID=66429 RepID=UPI0009969DB3
MGKQSALVLMAAVAVGLGSLVTGVPGVRAQAAERDAGGAPPPDGPPPALPVGLDEVTIPELQARMADGSLTSSALTAAYLRRIATVDPRINAVLRTDPTAMRQAAASDARHRRGSARGPLDGIPVLLKDNIDTRGMPTTAGSLALAGSPPHSDAALVTRLREAGAVILGKTNLSEWANFRAAKPTSGWSAVGGRPGTPT